MAKSTYVVTHTFKTPYVLSTHDPRNPTAVKFKVFKKGELLAGELKHVNGKPSFVMYNGVCVVPLSVIRAVVTKEIVSNSSGPEANTEPLNSETTRKVVVEKNPKTRYMDAALLGAAIGLGAIYLANKKGWIAVPAKINYAYGAGVGAALAAYIIFRQNNKPKVKHL